MIDLTRVRFRFRFFSRLAVAARRKKNAFAGGERGESLDQTAHRRLFVRGAPQTRERQRARLERGGGVFRVRRTRRRRSRRSVADDGRVRVRVIGQRLEFSPKRGARHRARGIEATALLLRARATGTGGFARGGSGRQASGGRFSREATTRCVVGRASRDPSCLDPRGSPWPTGDGAPPTGFATRRSAVGRRRRDDARGSVERERVFRRVPVAFRSSTTSRPRRGRGKRRASHAAAPTRPPMCAQCGRRSSRRGRTRFRIPMALGFLRHRHLHVKDFRAPRCSAPPRTRQSAPHTRELQKNTFARQLARVPPHNDTHTHTAFSARLDPPRFCVFSRASERWKTQPRVKKENLQSRARVRLVTLRPRNLNPRFFFRGGTPQPPCIGTWRALRRPPPRRWRRSR